MTCRSAVLIDNFLSQSDFNSISSRVASSPEYSSPNHHDTRDDLWRDVTDLVFKRMKEVQIYQPHFEEATKIANFSHNQYRPPNYGHGNFNGPHIDTGSYVFYIHPDWDENWEGQIKFTKAVEEEYRNGIFAKPNRFIWIQDNIYHDVTTTSPNATHSRVTNLGFLGGHLYGDPVGTDFINIFTEM